MFSFCVMLKPVLLAQVTQTFLQKKLDKILYYIYKGARYTEYLEELRFLSVIFHSPH